jgi:predicted chitinase
MLIMIKTCLLILSTITLAYSSAYYVSGNATATLSNYVTQTCSVILQGTSALKIRHPCAGLYTNSSLGEVQLSDKEVSDAFASLGFIGTSSPRLLSYFQYAVGHSKISSKTEAAMFLAHVCRNSGAFRYSVDPRCPYSEDLCKNDTLHNYYKRSYLMVSGEDTYKQLSQDIFNSNRLDTYPGLVSEDECVNWRVCIAYWERNVHDAVGVQEGNFGTSLQQLNQGCNKTDMASKMDANYRKLYYDNILKAFGMSHSANVTGCPVFIAR